MARVATPSFSIGREIVSRLIRGGLGRRAAVLARI